MSDGNYNRSHLPKNDFQSGVRAGKAAERTLALKAFSELLDEKFPQLPTEEKEVLCQHFRLKLSE